MRVTYKISESECNTFVIQIQHIAIKIGNHKNNVKYNRFFLGILFVYKIICVHLQCVFHGIRIKVNKDWLS